MRADTTFPQQAAERQAKLDTLHEKLTSAVESLVTGEDWRRAIEFAARFRSRSFNNTLLIWTQHQAAFEHGRVPTPVPSHVAGYRQWQSQGRQVDKGQAGYLIFAPVTGRFASSTPKDPASWRRLGPAEKPAAGETVRSRMVGAKPAYVWDVTQTTGDPIPELPVPRLLTGQAPAGLWDGLARIVADRGYTLHDAPDVEYLDGANGVTHWLRKTVHVRTDMDDAARTRTLAHEVGHLLLHNRDDVDAVVHRGIAEVEAESVALMIAAAHGMDTDQYTIPYVATWASRVPGQSAVETIQATAARVRTAALTLLDQLDTTQIDDGALPSLTKPLARTTASEPVAERPRRREGRSL